MHTPDGFITGWVCIVTLLFALIAIGTAVFTARKWLTKQKAYMMAGLAAVIFAFQMLNFPIGGGTSGHLIGGAIAAILLGPHAAVLILTAVLLVQTFVYGDGGVLALGLNILNMGIVAGYSAYYMYRPFKEKMPVVGSFIASWGSVVAAAISCAVWLGLSGTIKFTTALPAMVFTHMAVGLGEGIITAGVILYVLRTKSELVDWHKAPAKLFRYVALSTLLGIAVMAVFLPFASAHPDGLEAVALNLGFFESATTIYTLSPMPDYTAFGSEAYLAVLFAGVVGALATFGLSYLLTLPLVRKTEG